MAVGMGEEQSPAGLQGSGGTTQLLEPQPRSYAIWELSLRGALLWVPVPSEAGGR